MHTPTADYCLPGITRRTVMELIDQMPELPAVVQRKISLSEFHAADEVFTTGTMGELTPVRSIDGRRIGSSCSYQRPVTQAVQRAYRLLTEKEGVPIPL